MPIKTIIAATLAVALLSTAGAQSRRDLRDAPAPPPPVTQTIPVLRGEKLTVPLGIYGTRGEPLEFIIRSLPAHGRLSAVKSTGINSATVIYTPSPGNTAAEDRFSYAVRGSEGVSAPGVITIRFTERPVVPAKLKAPFDLEFPSVFPGQRSTVELEVENEGGSVLEGEVTVPAPWSIEGVKIFRLGGGQRATFKLVITPVQAGVQTADAVISGTQRKVIPLRVSTEVRLAATPPQLKLTAQPGSQTRTGALKIENRSAEEAGVTVEVSQRLMTDRTVKVPARGSSTVPIFADAATGSAFDDVVKLSSNEWKASIPVHVVAVGAILKFTGSEVKITGSAPVSGIAVLENSGGEAVTVRLDVARPFELENRVVTAPPHGSVEIPLMVRDPAAGTFRSSLQAIGEGGSAAVPVTAEISEPVVRRPSARPSAMPEAPTPNAPSHGNPPVSDSMADFPKTAREIPNALGRFARATGMHSAALDWPARLGPLANARIEERVLSLSESGALQTGWSPLTDVSITPAGSRVTAELRGLSPGTYYTVHVVTGQDEDAKVLFTSDFRTVPKKPFFSGSLLTPALVLTLGALAYAIWRSRHAPMQALKK